jgi:hypothetical protein
MKHQSVYNSRPKRISSRLNTDDEVDAPVIFIEEDSISHFDKNYVNSIDKGIITEMNSYF